MTGETETGSPLPCWASISFVGYVTYLGYVSEVEIAGSKLLKVEPISPDDGSAQPPRYRPASTIYEFLPATEEEIRAEVLKRQLSAVRRQQVYARLDGPPQLEEVEREAEAPHVYEGDDDVYDEPEGF